MKYLYESHLSGFYSTDDEQDYEDTYCEQCGDSDDLIGIYENLKDFWNLIKDECSINGSGGYCLQYIYPYMCNELGIDGVETDEQGFCDLSDEEILSRINKLISNI